MRYRDIDVARIDWLKNFGGPFEICRMEMLRRSEEFLQFLNSLLTEQDKNGVFLDEYKASVLQPRTSTPFSAFVGQQDRPTVVISKLASKTSGESPESVNLSVNLDEELELLVDLRTSSSLEDPLPVISQQEVLVGQPLESNRVYLTHSTPFYRGWLGTLIQNTTFARDRGLLPLPLGVARFITSLYSLGFRKATRTLPDVWVLCERNPRNIIALGCRCEGPGCPLNVFTMEGDATPHANPRASVDNDKLSDASAFSEYDIMRCSEEESRQSGEFKLQFSWNDPDGMFSPPPESSEAVLKLSCVPGDQFSPVLPMYEELQSLFRLCKILNGDVEWPACVDDEEILISAGNNTAEEVDAFIQEMAHPLTKPADITVMSPSTYHMIYEPRTDLDFTERLWLFCRDVSSFEELQLIFAEVFKALLLGKIQPFVHRKSFSKLATLLRQILLSPDRAALQDAALQLQFQLLLAEAQLLPCLVQLGIEKVRRDYQSFFVGTDICSAEQFERFFTPSSAPLVQCLELCRTHSVLELDASIMKVLGLPTTTILSSFTKAAMEVFKADPHYQPFEPTPVFSLPLSAYSPALKSVVAMCSKLSPVTWCATVQQDGQAKDVHLLKNQPLFHYLLEDSVTNTPSSTKDGCVYMHKCYCETVL